MAIRRRKTADNRAPRSDARIEDELAMLRAVLAHYPQGAKLFFGSPSRCPECGDYGLVVNVAHDTGRCSNNCRVCRRDWVITRRALRAHRAAPAVAPKPIGRGVLYEALLAEGPVADAPAEPVTAAPPPEIPMPAPPSPPTAVTPLSPAPVFMAPMPLQA
jgi:hypothetical protein